MQINDIIKKIASFKLQEDRAMLITCIGIAFVFWILVKLSQTYPTVKPIMLNIEMPEDKCLLEMPPDDVEAELRGTGWDLMLEHFYHSRIPVFTRGSFRCGCRTWIPTRCPILRHGGRRTTQFLRRPVRKLPQP